MNAKLSPHRFLPCNENGLIKTNQMIPCNLWVSSWLPFAVDWGSSWFVLIHSKGKLALLSPIGCWVSFELSWAGFHGRAKTYADRGWCSSKIGELCLCFCLEMKSIIFYQGVYCSTFPRVQKKVEYFDPKILPWLNIVKKSCRIFGCVFT